MSRNHIVGLIIGAPFILAAVFALWGNSEEDKVRRAVESFGQSLKNVSLLAPDARSSIRTEYGEFLSPELLEKWINDPSSALGRLTSSPYPEKIEIDSITKEVGSRYRVQGEIVEVTSTGEIGVRREITLVVDKRKSEFVITGISFGGYDVEYRNNAYGFVFRLPETWRGYSIVMGKWEGTDSENKKVAEGPIVLIRHPDWKEDRKRQDIPIMMFTLEQWNSLQEREGGFHVGAAPVNPTELGRNSQYVFALPARYNFAFPEGFEEVEQILQGEPLRVF